MTVSHFFNNMPELYAGTHLIISRAGASSVSEIAAVGIPSILVPLPIAADDHQTANAREIGDTKAGIVLKQKDFTPARLGELLKELMSSPKNCRKCPKTPNLSALPTPPSVLPTPSKKKSFPVRRRKTMFGLKLFKKNLLNLLPKVRGKYTPNVRLAKYTWFGVGGPAEVLYTPADAEDLSHFLKNKPYNLPVCVIGGGSNLLVRDGGVPGVVIRLDSPGFRKISFGENTVTCGAGVKNAELKKSCSTNSSAAWNSYARFRALSAARSKPMPAVLAVRSGTLSSKRRLSTASAKLKPYPSAICSSPTAAVFSR